MDLWELEKNGEKRERREVAKEFEVRGKGLPWRIVDRLNIIRTPLGSLLVQPYVVERLGEGTKGSV